MNFMLLAEGEQSGWVKGFWFVFMVMSNITFLLALLSIPSVLVHRRGRPQAALSWVLAMLTVPVVGLLLWWAMGRSHLERKRRKRRRRISKISADISKVYKETPAKLETKWELLPIERFPPQEAEWAFPPTINNQARLLVDAKETYAEIERMIRDAQTFIHIIFYIWQNDSIGEKFRDLLVEKANAGVQVRVLVDAFGSSRVVKHFMDPLREAGGEIAIFGPTILRRWHLEVNFRNHRKLVLVDGKEAVVGGLNIGEEYTHNWHDLAILLGGPSIDQLQEVFMEDWAFANGSDFVGKQYFGRWQGADEPDLNHEEMCEPTICAVIASGPLGEMNLTHEAFLLAIAGAKERIWLTTPYFVPDQTILAALRTAVFRGVEVRVLVPEEPDAYLVGLASRSYYPFLLATGIRIFEYKDDILHAKAAVIDHDIAFVGSANMDVRSFKLNFELSCFLECESLCQRLADLYESDIKKSNEIRTEDLNHRGYWTQVSEAAAHLMSPLL
jgi:cardiolipin synthase A/B